MAENMHEESPSEDRLGSQTTPENTDGSAVPPSAMKPSFTFDSLAVMVHNWWTESDFQMKLFFVLLFWLVMNLSLIWICWRKYGDKLSQMLLKEEGGKDSFDGKIELHPEDPLHNKYHPQTEKIHRD